MRIAKLQGWDEESNKRLEELQKECLEKNKSASYDDTNTKENYCVIKLKNSKGESYFLIQKRKYTKKVNENKDKFTDEIVNKVKQLFSENKTKIEISKLLNITPYFITKILQR